MRPHLSRITISLLFLYKLPSIIVIMSLLPSFFIATAKPPTQDIIKHMLIAAPSGVSLMTTEYAP